MNKEDYVSYEVANMLEEKGYREPCFATYTPKDKSGNYRLSRHYPYDCYSDLCKVKQGDGFNEYLAPSLYNAAKWLRKEHDIHIQIDYEDSQLWGFVIYNMKIDCLEDTCSMYNSYEEALNEGIKEALKLI